MELSVLKQRLQRHLTDGLVTIVGSGLSVAEGIPGMAALADHLITSIPAKVLPASEVTWESIRGVLESGDTLENVLLAHPPDQSLEALIGTAISRSSTESSLVMAR